MKETAEERMAKAAQNMTNLQTAYEKFANSPRYVSSHRGYPEMVELRFNREDAIETVYVEVNWRGEIAVNIVSWSACTDKARKAIENKTFETAEEALDYALETVNKINEFFNQF